jgi:hypothetical protein
MYKLHETLKIHMANVRETIEQHILKDTYFRYITYTIFILTLKQNENWVHFLSCCTTKQF